MKIEKIVFKHQLEVRFSHILDFPKVMKSILSPYTKLTSRINIKNEGSVNEVITLFFEGEYYQILALWDRLVFIYQGDTKELSKNNSIVEDPFFEILNKLKKEASFGEMKNILISSNITLLNEKDFDQNLSLFRKIYFSEKAETILGNQNDLAITGEINTENIQSSFVFGPFSGNTELQRKNIEIKRSDYLDALKKSGLAIDTQYFEASNKIDFSSYQKGLKNEEKIITNIWNSYHL